MKICILSSFEDSMQKDSGASIRIYNLAKGLAANGNDTCIVIPAPQATNELVEGVTVHGLKGLTPRPMLEILRKFAGIARPTALYFYDLLFLYKVTRLVRKSDIVQIEQQVAGGLLIPFIKRILRKPVVVDCHDVFQALRVHHTSLLRKVLETFLEKSAYRNADLILTVSKVEKEYLLSTSSQNSDIVVVPNGVDTALFTKSPEPTQLREKYGAVNSKIVVFVGNLKYLPNREAVQVISSVIAPRILEEIKDVKFLVVGKKQDGIELSRLTFTGYVERVADILNISDVAVAPLFQGSGTRLKILEYFSCGLPVVSTSVGAEGLDVKNGVNIFIEDDMESFALRTVELLRDKNRSIEMGKAARALVTGTYDWKLITTDLASDLIRLLSVRTAHVP